MPKDRIKVDVTPEAHSNHVGALAIVSFTLGCGCYVPYSSLADACRVIELKKVGSTYDCPKHNGQIITQARYRLVGWADEAGGERG